MHQQTDILDCSLKGDQSKQVFLAPWEYQWAPKDPQMECSMAAACHFPNADKRSSQQHKYQQIYRILSATVPLLAEMIKINFMVKNNIT